MNDNSPEVQATIRAAEETWRGRLKMSRVVLWVVGEPGVGKTTLTRDLLRSYGAAHDEIASPKWTLFAGGAVAAAGWWRGGAFDGADTLAISQIKPAMAYWRDELTSALSVLDGDKLANAGAVQVARDAGARVLCVHLVAPGLAAERRVLRGTQQNSAWVKGRQTKARRFFEAFQGEGFECLPSTASISAVRGLILTGEP